MSNWIVNEPDVLYKTKTTSNILSKMEMHRETGEKVTFFPYNLNAIKINKYTALYYKLSKIGKLPANWDDEGALSTSQTAISIGRILIDVFDELELIEKNIYIHILPTFNGGIQFELDGHLLKADIEISSDDHITLTKYIGKTNKATELHFSKNNLTDLKRVLL